MIISKTPFRVSLFGGGSDYENFYSKHGSMLIGFTFDKYNYISYRKTPSIVPYKTRLCYSKTEVVNRNAQIQHDGIRGVLEYFNIKYGVDINNTSELPAQTGTGSSSSFIVGLLNCIYKFKNKKVSKKQLAEEAIFIERKLLNEPGGIQDQIWAAYGGINSITIHKDGCFDVKPLPVSESFKEEFMDRSVLLYTGKTRKSFRIANEIKKNDNEDAKKKILDISYKAHDKFYEQDIDGVGKLLNQTWIQKKKLSKLVNSPHVQEMHKTLLDCGMIGGKLLGAGGSGFIFGIMKSSKTKQELKKKYKTKYISINIEYNGSEIINF